MIEGSPGVEFLVRNDSSLAATSEARNAAARAEVSPSPTNRIDSLVQRLERIGERSKTPITFGRVENLADRFIEAQIIQSNDVPQSYFENQLRLAAERGYGEQVIDASTKRQMIESIREEQTASLKMWTDYLTSPEAEVYPTWFRLYVLRNVSRLGVIDKARGIYPKRDEHYVGVFPELNREVLGIVYDRITEASNIIHDENQAKQSVVEVRQAQVAEVKQRKDLLSEEEQLAYRGGFRELYYMVGQRLDIEQRLNARVEGGLATDGEWRTFAEGQTGELTKSLQGRGTGWCIASENTAEKYLEMGEIHIYYTKSGDGSYSIPRTAIRMENNSVAEVRGVEKGQNIEPDILAIAKEKYENLPGGDLYEKKNQDMQRLTEISKKTTDGLDLSPEEIRFLYERDSSIDGFGYGRDPRIDKTKETRRQCGLIRQDYAAIYEVAVEHVVQATEELTPESVVLLQEGVVRVDTLLNVPTRSLRVIEGKLEWGGDHLLSRAEVESLSQLESIDGKPAAEAMLSLVYETENLSKTEMNGPEESEPDIILELLGTEQLLQYKIIQSEEELYSLNLGVDGTTRLFLGIASRSENLTQLARLLKNFDFRDVRELDGSTTVDLIRVMVEHRNDVITNMLYEKLYGQGLLDSAAKKRVWQFIRSSGGNLEEKIFSLFPNETMT